MGLRAIVFDFDGTLADSYAAITASVNHVRAQFGMGPLLEGDVRRHVGRGPDYLMTHTVPGIEPRAAVIRYRAHHPSVMRAGTRLLPGVAATLPLLKDAGLRLGICSNKPVDFTRELLAFFGLAALIDRVLGPEDVPRPKPAPDMLLAALAQLEVASTDTLYIGDMVVDIQTARAAGVTVWVVPTGSDEPAALAEAGPDRVLAGLAELPGLILGEWPPSGR